VVRVGDEEVTVHFKGWSSRYDETLPSFSARIWFSSRPAPAPSDSLPSSEETGSACGQGTTSDANLEQRTDISIVRSGERYYEGTVSYVNSNGPGAPSIRVDFDDGTDGVRVSFLPTSPSYVETDMYEAI
jgi:hypothetical protein